MYTLFQFCLVAVVARSVFTTTSIEAPLDTRFSDNSLVEKKAASDIPGISKGINKNEVPEYTGNLGADLGKVYSAYILKQKYIPNAVCTTGDAKQFIVKNFVDSAKGNRVQCNPITEVEHLCSPKTPCDCCRPERNCMSEVFDQNEAVPTCEGVRGVNKLGQVVTCSCAQGYLRLAERCYSQLECDRFIAGLQRAYRLNERSGLATSIFNAFSGLPLLGTLVDPFAEVLRYAIQELI